MFELPAIHGHRGARGLFPENSMVSILAAIDSGCDSIEVDLCVTRDNRVVVLHDPVLSGDITRTAKGHWLEKEIIVRQTLYKDLEQLDIGRIRPNTEYAERFPDQKGIDGVTIPTLENFIDMVLDQERQVGFNLEFKSTPYLAEASPTVEEFAFLVSNIIQQYGIASNTFIQSFDWRMGLAMKERIPELKIGFTTDLQPDGSPLSPVAGNPTPWTNNQDLSNYRHSIPRMLEEMGADVWSSNHLDLSDELLNESRERGLQVYVWTVNSIEDMDRMISMGVDAITTDYPDRLMANYKNRDKKPGGSETTKE